MLSFTFPWVAGAGALLALVPVVLHLLVRRPPPRVDLPTVRFLDPHPRTRVSLRRRPSDLLLLLLRMAFLALLGMALAGPVWAGSRSGLLTVVMVDRGRGVGTAWAGIRTAAREEAADAPGSVRVLVMGERVEEIPESALGDGNGMWSRPDTAESSYVEGFQELRRLLARETVADSVEVVLVTRLRSGGWTPGFGSVRPVLFPGSVRIRAVEPPGVEADGPGDPGGAGTRATVVAAAADGRFVAAALEALGREVEVVAAGGDLPHPDPVVSSVLPPGGVIIVPGPLDGSAVPGLLARTVAGDTVVVEGGFGPGPIEDLPGGAAAGNAWRSGGDSVPGSDPPAFLVVDGQGVPGAGGIPGRPGDGALVPLARDDGHPAAGAVRTGRGCWVAAGFPLEGGDLPFSPAYPRVLEALVAACRGGGPDGGSLDRGALAVLGGDGAPSRLPVESAGGVEGRPLARWFLMAALLLAILEAVLGYLGPHRTRESTP